MKIKTIITLILLLFVCFSVGYIVIEQLRLSPQTNIEKLNTSAVAEPNKQPSKQPVAKVVVYYFHGTARCPTCRKFESHSNEALHQAFAEELNKGSLEWKVVNVDEPGNQHYLSDYQLYSKSIVIVKIQDGKQLAWKNLNRIWELVHNKDAFINYIQDEVKSYLEAK